MTVEAGRLWVRCDRCSGQTFRIGLRVPMGVIIRCTSCGLETTSPTQTPAA